MANAPPPVYLYILMRTDMASMNAGKACAQATHAANQMVYSLRDDVTDHANLLGEWESATEQGFGTTIVLGVNEKQMRQTVEMAREMGLHAGITHDPTYPLVDGQVVHLIPLDTCGWLLCRKGDAAFPLAGLDLMP